jgi:ATP-dependent DNA helicase RecG
MVLSQDAFATAFPDEGDHVEWKEGFSQRRIQEAVVAFSNSGGGVIVIGVTDLGRVVGRDLTEGMRYDLHRAISEVHDTGRYDLYSLLVGDRSVSVVSVSRRENGFAQLSDGRVLVRRGKMNTALLGAELREFVSARSLVRFDRTGAGVRLDEADPALLARLQNAYGWTDGTELPDRLVEHGLVLPMGGRQELTIAGAGYLLAHPEAVLGKSLIEIFRYPAEAEEYDRRDTVAGPFDEQVRVATRLIVDELGTDLVVLGTLRHDLPRIPEVVIREAIANAVAHRDYELHGVSTRVDMTPDFVRITSPGRLPEPVTIHNLREAQSARNPEIIGVLRRLRLAEDAGRGIDVMQDEMQAELLDRPQFEEGDRTVEVILATRSTVTPRERAWVREVERRGHIEPRDRALLVHAARGEGLTNATVRSLLGVDSVDARQALQRLRDAGFLRQLGERGGTRYRLSGDLTPPAGLQLGREELEDLVLDLAAEGPVTNAIVRARTGVDRVAAKELLGRLVADGTLEKQGERRGTRYTLVEKERELGLPE